MHLQQFIKKRQCLEFQQGATYLINPPKEKLHAGTTGAIVPFHLYLVRNNLVRIRHTK